MGEVRFLIRPRKSIFVTSNLVVYKKQEDGVNILSGENELKSGVTSGFKLKGYSNILVNEPIKSSNWKLIRGTGGFLWESSADVLSLAGITACGDLQIDGCQTECKTFRQD